MTKTHAVGILQRTKRSTSGKQRSADVSLTLESSIYRRLCSAEPLPRGQRHTEGLRKAGLWHLSSRDP